MTQQTKTTYYSRYGVTKQRGNCYAVAKDGLVGFYSYGTVIGFISRNKEAYFRGDRFSNTTTRHVYSLKRHACANAPIKHENLSSEEFWEAMFKEGVIDCFDYRSHCYDRNPFDKERW